MIAVTQKVQKGDHGHPKLLFTMTVVIVKVRKGDRGHGFGRKGVIAVMLLGVG